MVLISVIIPTYGIPLYLDKTIQSVQKQTLSCFELIIVDDNNPETEARNQTAVLVNKFMLNDNRIKYLKHERNQNGAIARNTGFAIAKGKYISLLDSDDLYAPDRLEKCYNAMEKAPQDVAGVYTGCEFRKSGVTYNRFTNVKSGNHLVDTLACRFMICTGSNIFVKKTIVDELNGFDGAFLRHQDYEFLVRLFERYSLIAIPEILVVKNNENFNLPNLEKQIAIKKQYLDKYKYIIDKLPEKDVNHIMHGNYMNIAENAVSRCNFKVANEYYNLASQYGGLSIKEWVRRLALPIYNKIRK